MIDVWLITPADSNDYYALPDVGSVLDELRPLLEDVEVGDGYTIRRRQMTREEYDALPEWDGF